VHIPSIDLTVTRDSVDEFMIGVRKVAITFVPEWKDLPANDDEIFKTEQVCFHALTRLSVRLVQIFFD
jgi:hypothetical protein